MGKKKTKKQSDDVFKYSVTESHNIKDLKLYQISVRGQLACFNGPTTIKSKFIFTSEEKANEYMEEFLKICSTPKNEEDLTYINIKDYKPETTIIELVVKE